MVPRAFEAAPTATSLVRELICRPRSAKSSCPVSGIIFAIRTRRVPFFRSRPGAVLTLATFAVIAVGIVLTVSPLAHQLGFTTLPWQFYTALVLMSVAYLVLVEVTKKVFYADPMHMAGQPQRARGRKHRVHRRAARFSHGGKIAHSTGRTST